MSVLAVTILAGVTLGGALGPVLATLLAMMHHVLADAMSQAISLVLIRKELAGEGEHEVLRYLFRTNPLNLGQERYVLLRKFVRPLSAVSSVWFRHVDVTWRLARWRGALLLYLPARDGVAKILYLRGAIDFEAFLKEVAQMHNDLIQAKAAASGPRRFAVYRLAAGGMEKDTDETRGRAKISADETVPNTVPIGWAADDLGMLVEGHRTADLSLTPEMEMVLKDVRFWYDKEEWYRDHCIPWRRGYLFHGPPGAGKTSLIRAIAEELDLPVFQFDLSGMDNATFIRHWEKISRSGSRIVLFEDFDTVFKGRENVSRDSAGGGLTYDTILNSLDGIQREDGLLLFITTNHPEHIDEAMGIPDGKGRSTRPGRVDVTIGFSPLGHAGRVKIAMRILGDEALAERLAREGADDSPAQLTNRCVMFAMDILAGERDAAGDAVPPAGGMAYDAEGEYNTTLAVLENQMAKAMEEAGVKYRKSSTGWTLPNKHFTRVGDQNMETDEMGRFLPDIDIDKDPSGGATG